MAGDRDNSEQNGNLDKTYQWQCHNSLDSSRTLQPSQNDEFKKRKSAEQRTIVKNISLLQDSILR